MPLCRKQAEDKDNDPGFKSRPDSKSVSRKIKSMFFYSRLAVRIADSSTMSETIRYHSMTKSLSNSTNRKPPINFRKSNLLLQNPSIQLANKVMDIIQPLQLLQQQVQRLIESHDRVVQLAEERHAAAVQLADQRHALADQRHAQLVQYFEKLEGKAGLANSKKFNVALVGCRLEGTVLKKNVVGHGLVIQVDLGEEKANFILTAAHVILSFF